MIPIANSGGVFTRADIDAIYASIAAIQWTGNTYYLDPVNGLDTNNGLYPASLLGQAGNGPVKTLAAAYALLVSGNNDTIVLIGNGASSGTARVEASFTWSKNACRLIGIAAPSVYSQRARIAPTASDTAFTPFITVSGNGNYFANLEIFDAFTTGTTAQINLVVSGVQNVFDNCHIAGMGDSTSAGDAGSRSLVISNDENFFRHCTLGVDTIKRTALNATVELKAGSAGAARNVFEDCYFPALCSTGAAGLAVIVAAAAAIDRMTIFRRCLFYNSAAFSGGAAGTGVMKLVAAAGGALLLQDCTEYGYTDWGYDAASKLEILVSGPVPTSNTSGIAIVNT